MWFWWFVAQLAIDPMMINCRLWKPISQFHTFQHPNGQMGITCLRIIWFQNLNHHYKWENVYFSNIPITQFWPCAQKSLILTEWVTFCLYLLNCVIKNNMLGLWNEPWNTGLSKVKNNHDNVSPEGYAIQWPMSNNQAVKYSH